jgi:hypothetical protein
MMPIEWFVLNPYLATVNKHGPATGACGSKTGKILTDQRASLACIPFACRGKIAISFLAPNSTLPADDSPSGAAAVIPAAPETAPAGPAGTAPAGPAGPAKADNTAKETKWLARQ